MKMKFPLLGLTVLETALQHILLDITSTLWLIGTTMSKGNKNNT